MLRPGIVRWRGDSTRAARVEGGRSAVVGRPQQRLADPALLGLAGEAVLEPVEATGHGGFGGWLDSGLHVVAVHPYRGGARKPGLVGGGLVDDQGGAELGVDAELGPDPLHQRQRPLAEGAGRPVRDQLP
jgi:hypothetical protein